MKTRRSNYALAAVCMMLGISYSAQAQQRNIYVSVNNTKEVNTDNINYISSLDGGIVFGLGKHVYAGGGMSLTKVWGDGYSSLGAGIGPDLHLHIITNDKFRFVLEGKGRVMYFFPEYQADALNYAFWGGPMVEFSLSERHKLKLGICYNHLSNAKPIEQIYNKSLDGLGLNIGWSFY